ncbi:MAG TPA: DUF885 family protein, partial [Actinomycetes bacterium]|nr:DUF885 family protein [Actinomycetes bacterium]
TAARRRALDILFEADLLDRPVAEVLARHRDDREAGALDAYTVELVRLRALAQARLGGRFDLPAFHDLVLGTGGVPLSVLAEAVDGT